MTPDDERNWHEPLYLRMRRRHLGSKQFINDHYYAPGRKLPGPMAKGCRHVGEVGERFNGDNRIVLPLEAVITLQQNP